MTKKFYTKSYFTKIADAIRSVKGVTTKYKISEMASAINGISTTSADTWKVTAGSSANAINVTLPKAKTKVRFYAYAPVRLATYGIDGTTYAYSKWTISWGDGSTSIPSSSGYVNHTYSAAGSYQITLSFNVSGISTSLIYGPWDFCVNITGVS